MSLPSPLWNTHISFVDTEIHQIPVEKLDPKLVKWLRRVSKNYGFEDLQNEMKRYPEQNLSSVDGQTDVFTVRILLQTPPEAK